MNEENISPENSINPENIEGSKGAAGGVIIIVLLLIIGGVYVFLQKQDTIIDEQIKSLETQSSSTEISDIEADVEVSDLENLDRELDEITNELEADLI